MNPVVMRIYNTLPPVFQSLAASIVGYKLNRYRYGSHFQEMLPHIAERESWSLDQWRDYQRLALGKLLRRAVDRVPYYRRLRAQGAYPIERIKDVEDLSLLPIVEKRALRSNPFDFLADDRNPRRMYEEHTSGTTGSPVRLFWSSKTHQEWFAIFEQRLRRWNGVRLGDRWGLLGGQLVVSRSRNKPPFWVWNFPTRQLYFSVHHLAPQFMDYYLDEIQRRGLTYILGYPSALNALAVHALDKGRSDLRLKVAIGNAESFFHYQRTNVEKAFHCATRDSYGNAELVAAAFECSHGSLHVSPDVGVIEIVGEKGNVLPPGNEGEMVCTGLLNQDHVLIRYRIGDAARLANHEDRCICGLQMPVIQSIIGRRDDILTTLDGRMINTLDMVFTSDVRVKEAQVAQVAFDKYIVRCVPDSEFGETDREAIRKGVIDRIGNVSVEIETVSSIPRTRAGKLKAVVNEMDGNPSSKDREKEDITTNR